MPTTNRPFFGNFFSAFRARTHPTLKASSAPSPSNPTANFTSHFPASSPSAAQPAQHLHTAQTAALVAAQSQQSFRPTARALHAGLALPRTPSPSPQSPTTHGFAYGSSPSSHAFAVARSRTPSQTRGDSASSGAVTPQLPTQSQSQDTPGRGGSVGSAHSAQPSTSSAAVPANTPAAASSSFGEGWKAEQARGRGETRQQTWYIGGRTASGEESFYSLGIVKRYRSADRMSLDRLSM